MGVEQGGWKWGRGDGSGGGGMEVEERVGLPGLGVTSPL